MRPFPKCKDCFKILASYKSVRCNRCNNIGRVFSEATRRKLSVTNSSKPSVHKVDCVCSFCKAKRGEYSGENNSRWLGRKSYELYPITFTPSLKRRIRIRDDNTCMICNKSEEENNRKLDVHHIDYNKDNCADDNLISLCKSCHVQTNRNRDHWQEVCTRMIKAWKWFGDRANVKTNNRSM